MLIPGPTVVVSPLIALQEDQVGSLQAMDAGEAVAVNSTQTERQRLEALQGAGNGELEFLFLAPEQLANPDTRGLLAETRPSLVVVDEAHCISEWGHDFRPDYLRLGALIEGLAEPRPVILALTATASPVVRGQIATRLRMRDPHLTVLSFDRPNLFLEVVTFVDDDAKRQALVERVVAAPRPGIVYVATRRSAEQLAEALGEAGVKAAPYHAGLKSSTRQETQEAFMAGSLEAVVATVAFGLGIDKPDVRFVYHLDVPDSLDSYYQEIGRAGRDGEPAEAVLFFRAEDAGRQRFLGAAPGLEEAEAQAVAAVLGRHSRMSWEELMEATELSAAKLALAVTRLEEEGVLEVGPGGVKRRLHPNRWREAVASAVEGSERHAAFERTRLQMMEGYATTRDCRRGFLLNYFGEAYADPCHQCDNCRAGTTRVEDPGDFPFPLGSTVRHQTWGQGVVHRYEGDVVVVLFPEAGYRTLSLELVSERGLLRQA